MGRKKLNKLKQMRGANMLFEKTSGGPEPTGCMELMATKCAGESGQPIGTQGHFPCPYVDGAFALTSLVGQQVAHDGTMHPTGDSVWTVDTVGPNSNYPPQSTPNSSLTTNAVCDDDTTSSECDISWNTPCAQQELATGGGLGGQNSWDPWLALRQTDWDSVGCQHLQSVVNWTTNQLNSGVTGNGTPLNQTQIARKTAKREWAQCQAAQCDCPPLNVPPLTSSGTDSCLQCTETAANPTVPGCCDPTAANYDPTATCNDLSCIAYVYGCTDPLAYNYYAGAQFDDGSCIYTPGAGPEKKTGKGDEKSRKKEVMKEEFTRMKTLWKYRI